MATEIPNHVGAKSLSYPYSPFQGFNSFLKDQLWGTQLRAPAHVHVSGR